MKKITLPMLLFIALPVHAQGLLNTLNQHQSTLTTSSSSTSTSSTESSTTTSTSTSVSGGRCEENEQTSLPLAYLTSLIQEKDAKLEVLHDNHAGTLTISAPQMISNCSSMLEWKMKKQEKDGALTYAVEVAFREGDDCGASGCKYKVAKVENGAFKEQEEMVLKPTLRGFEQCLEQSGVVSGGKVVPGAIYSAPLEEKFNDVAATGNILFVSHGPSSAQVKAKYGRFSAIEGCDHYESIHPQLNYLLSAEDEERQLLDAEAEKLRECSINEYHKVADFLERYQDYADELGEVRDRLILEAAKQSAKDIEEGNYDEDDIKVMEDFDRYIVAPRIAHAKSLYAVMLTLEGDSKRAKQAELATVLNEIKALNAKPYFLSTHTQRLIRDGRFEDADKLNTMKLTLDAHQRLGQKVSNVVITPEVAAARVEQARAAFASEMVLERERYEIRTGQVTGQSDYYHQLANSMRQNVQRRTQNYMQEIQAEYGRVQPGGYCYSYFRNTQKCIQDSVSRIQELQQLLQHYNKVDNERAAEYDAKAEEYGRLEAEGRRYIAAQNGEELPPEEPQTQPTDTTVPQPRVEEPHSGVYTFNFQQPQQPQMPQQGYPQQQYQTMPYMQQGMFQQQQNPYGAQAFHSPWMGQQSYGFAPQYGYGQGSYNFNWGGGGQMFAGQQMHGQQGWGLPQQQGYWGSPYGAYNMYSMYGR